MQFKSFIFNLTKGDPVTNLSTSFSPWKVLASINYTSETNGVDIILQNEAIVDSDGKAIFNTLGLSKAVSNIQLEYYIEKPFGINS